MQEQSQNAYSQLFLLRISTQLMTRECIDETRLRDEHQQFSFKGLRG
jgi:hypothetical protein